MRRIVIGLVSIGLAWSALAALALTSGFETSVEAGLDLLSHRRILKQIGPRRQPRRPLLVWMGDSTMLSHHDIVSYPKQITRRLGRRVEAVSVYRPGFDLYHHYFLLGRVLQLSPDVIVLALHLRLFHAEVIQSRNDLASAIPMSELARAMRLPLHARGLTIPKLLLLRGLRFSRLETGYLFFEGLRQRFHDGEFWELAGARLPPLPHVVDGARLDVMKFYNEPLHPRHPMIAMLRAVVEAAVRKNARLLAVVSPIPVSRLKEFDFYDGEVFRRRIALLQEAVEEEGGHFLDLHALVPKKEFFDELGHTGKGGTARVVAVLNPRIDELIGQALSERASKRSRSGARQSPGRPAR